MSVIKHCKKRVAAFPYLYCLRYDVNIENRPKRASTNNKPAKIREYFSIVTIYITINLGFFHGRVLISCVIVIFHFSGKS